MHLRARVCANRYDPREQRRATQSVLPAQARESADGGGYARLKHGLTVRLRLQRLLQRLHTQRHRSALLLLQRLEARKLCLDSIDLSVRLLDLCACRGSIARTHQHEGTRSHACPRGSRAGAEHCARQRGSLVHACSRDSTRGATRCAVACDPAVRNCGAAQCQEPGAPNVLCAPCTACTMHRMHHAAHAPCGACTMRRMHRVHPSTALPRTVRAPHRRRTPPCSGLAAAVLHASDGVRCTAACRSCCASRCARSRAAPRRAVQGTGTCSASWSARTMYPCVSSLSFVSSFSACLASFAMCARLSSYSP